MTSLIKPTISAVSASYIGLELDAVATDSDLAVSNLSDWLSKRLTIDVLLKLPILVFPVSSRSTSAIVVDLGGLSIANELRVVPDVFSDGNIPAVVDWMNVHWSSVKVSRYSIYIFFVLKTFLCSVTDILIPHERAITLAF